MTFRLICPTWCINTELFFSTSLLLQSVKHGNINIPETKAYIVLREFAKEEDATIDKIFRGLEKMGRDDIICTLYPTVLGKLT